MTSKTTSILGVQIDDISSCDVIDLIAKTISAQHRAIIANVNTHAMNIAYEQPKFRQTLNASDVVFCDGYGVKWASALLEQSIRHRHTPPDWIMPLCERAVADDFTLYFLGAQPGVAEAAAKVCLQHVPSLRIVGCHDGYFDLEQGSQGSSEVIAEINQLKPDILVLGMGMPLQEYWVHENWSQLDVSVAIAAGAIFDYVSGNIPRAPRWITDNGFEWLARFVIEPRRLWMRYLIGNPLFLSRVLKEHLFGTLTASISKRFSDDPL